MSMNMALYASKHSPDPSTKVGCVITDRMGTVIAVGFNDFPEKMIPPPDAWDNRDKKYARVVHAEMSAIISAMSQRLDIKNSIVYVTEIPCNHCCSALIQAGVKKIVTRSASDDFWSRWYKQIVITYQMLDESGVELELLDR